MTPFEELIQEHKALLKLTNEIVEQFVPPDDELNTTERLLMIRLEHYRQSARNHKIGGISDA